MIRHIVMWKFADEAEGHTRDENLDIVKGKLEALYKSGKIEGLRSLELGKDTGRTDMSYDMVLITDFDSMECLKAYKIHPDHVVISQYVKKVRVARTTVDYEL